MSNNWKKNEQILHTYMKWFSMEVFFPNAL